MRLEFKKSTIEATVRRHFNKTSEKQAARSNRGSGVQPPAIFTSNTGETQVRTFKLPPIDVSGLPNAEAVSAPLSVCLSIRTIHPWSYLTPKMIG